MRHLRFLSVCFCIHCIVAKPSVTAAADGFVLGHSARFGIKVEAPGMPETWCSSSLSLQLIGETAAQIQRSRVEEFLASAMTKLLALKCSIASNLELEVGTRSTNLFHGEANLLDGKWQIVSWIPIRAAGNTQPTEYDPILLPPADRQVVENLEVIEPAPVPEPVPAVEPTGAGFCGSDAGPGSSLAVGIAMLEGARLGDVALPMQVLTTLANGGFPLDPPPGEFPLKQLFGEWVQHDGGRSFLLQLEPDGHWRWYRVEPPDRDSAGQIRVLRRGTFTLHPSTYPFALCLSYRFPKPAGPYLALIGILDAHAEDESIQLAILDEGQSGVQTQILLGRSDREKCRDIYRKAWDFWHQSNLYYFKVRLYYVDIVKKIGLLEKQILLHKEYLDMKKGELNRANEEKNRAVILLAVKTLEAVTLQLSRVAEYTIGSELGILEESSKPREKQSPLRVVAEILNPAFAIGNAGMESLAAAAKAWRIGQEYEALRNDPIAQQHARDIDQMKIAYEKFLKEIYDPFMASNRPLVEMAQDYHCERFLAGGAYPSSPFNPSIDLVPMPSGG